MLGPLVVATERHVRVRDARFVVRVQVVRRVEQREDVGEAVADEPDQLFLAPDLAVVAGEAAGPLRRREAVLDDPAERRAARGPAPSVPSRSTAFHVDRAHDVEQAQRVGCAARVVHPDDAGAVVEGPDDGRERARRRASDRASSPQRRRARNDLRDGPTSTGTSTRSTSSRRRASSVEVVRGRLAEADARVGARATPSAMPAARAASSRSTRKSPTSATTSS